MTVVPFAPWEPDKADLNGQTTGDILNVLPSTGSYLPFPDFTALSSILGANGALVDRGGNFIVARNGNFIVTATSARTA